MSILERLWSLPKKKGAIGASSLGFDASAFVANHSGVPISERTSLSIAAVWACVRVIAETIGALPVHVIRQSGKYRFRAPEHPVEGLIAREPNLLMTSPVFREVMTASVVLWGNGYAVIMRDSLGRPGELIPVPPDQVFPQREGLSVLYRIVSPDLGTMTVPARDMLHIPGLSFDGVKGLSPIAYHRQAIGVSKAAEEFAARMFSQGIRASGVVEHPSEMSDEAYERLRESFSQSYAGLSNSHRAIILEEGAKWKQTTIPPEDAQFLETRKFQATEIARIFRVPPHMIADLERATFSNIEHQGLEFVTHTILPWVVRWEAELRRKLFSASERRVYAVKFSLEGLLRGDIRNRYMAYAIGRQNGWLSANDIRELEDMNPIEGGDVYLVPVNMQPADAIEEAAKEAEKEDAKATDPGTAAEELRALLVREGER